MIRQIIAVFLAVLCVFAVGCTGNPREKSSSLDVKNTSNTEKRKLIIDTDTAGDDAVALIMAAKDKNVDILGVTVSAGNVKLNQAVDNALMTLEIAGSNAPVYKGAYKTYNGKERKTFSVFGKDGMGDQGLIHPKRKAEKKSAVDFIIDTVKAYPGEVEIVALGPVTNLALAFDKDKKTMKRVKKYWSMGTCGFGKGNASPVAEFNVYHDAPAYKVLAGSGVPITAIGLDMLSEDSQFTKKELDEYKKKGGLLEFVAKAYSGLLAFNKEARGAEFGDIPDGEAMACVLWDGYLKETKPCHASVMTENNDAYGQVILFQKDYGYDSGIKFKDYNFNVAYKTDCKIFKEKLKEILSK